MQSAEISQRDSKIEIPHTLKPSYEEVKCSESAKRKGKGGKTQSQLEAECSHDILSRSVHRSLDDVSLFINRRRADEEDEELNLVEGCDKTFSQRQGFAQDFEETSQIQNENDLKIVSDFNQISQQQQQQLSNPQGSSPSYFKSGEEDDTKLEYSKTNSGQLELQQEEDEVIEPTKQLNILSFIQTQLKAESIEVELPKVDVERRGNVRDYLQRKKDSLVGRKPATSVNGRGNQGQSGGVIEENQWKIFAKMRKVRKFCKALLDRRFFAKYVNMSKLNIEAISDSSGFFDDKSKTIRSKSNTVINKILQAIEKTFEGVEVVMPQSALELTWNILMFVVLLQQFLLIPIEICFDLNLTNSLFLFFFTFLLPAVVLSFDMLAHFNLAYYHNGKLITDRVQIFQNYIRTTFPVNLLTVITFLLHNKIYFIQLALLLRIQQLPRLLGKIDDNFQLQQRYNTPFELIKLLMLVFGCAHFVACGFHFVATRVELLGEDTWIEKQNLQHSGKDMRYLQSIYYAIITMVTVGYGDITPISWQEKIYVIVVTILSCGMFGYSMNTIGAIFQEIAKREANFKQVKYDMGQYMRSRDIPKFLQTKVLKNLEYSNILNGDQVQKGEAIMNTLTMTLRNQIKLRLEICLHMKEIIFQPGEILFDSDQVNDRIYFLHKGSVEMIQLNQSKQNSSVIGLAQSGSMLGQYGFFTNQPEILQARCQDTCYLLYCDRANFQQVLSKYEYDREVFCKLRDNLLVYNRQFDTTCFSCGKIGHETSKCPFYSTYQIGAPMCIYRHLRSTPQSRDGSVVRRSLRSQNTLGCRWDQMVEARRVRLNFFYLAFEGAQAAILEDEELELEANDMDFLLFVPKVRFKDDQAEYSEGEISNFSEDQYVQERKELARYSYQLSFSPETHRQLQLARKSYKPQGENAQVPLVGNGALQRVKTTCSKRLEPLSVYSECSEDSSGSSQLSNIPSDTFNQAKEKVINIANFQNNLSNQSLPVLPIKRSSYRSLSSSKNSSHFRKKSGSSPISRFSLSSSHNGQSFMEQSSQMNNIPSVSAKTKKASVFAQHQQQILAKPRGTLINLDGDFSASDIPSIPEISPLPTNQTSNELKRNHGPYKSLSIQLQKEKILKEKPPQINSKTDQKSRSQTPSGVSQNKSIQKSLPELTEVPPLKNTRRSFQALTNQSEYIQPKSKRESSLLSRVSIGSLKRDSQEQILFSTILTKPQQLPGIKQSPQINGFKLDDSKQKIQSSPRQFSSLGGIENFMIINNFDISKNFKGYYPSNNISRVLAAWRARYMKLFFKKNKTRSSRVKNRLSRNLEKEKRPCSIILKSQLNLKS